MESCFGAPHLHIIGSTPSELKVSNLSTTSLNLLRATGLNDHEIEVLHSLHKLTDEKVKIISENYPKFSLTSEPTLTKVTKCYIHSIKEQTRIAKKEADLAIKKERAAEAKRREHENRQKRIDEIKAELTPKLTQDPEVSDPLINKHFVTLETFLRLRKNGKPIVAIGENNTLITVEKINTLAYIILCILNFISAGKINGPKYSSKTANRFEVLKTIANKLATFSHWDPNTELRNTNAHIKKFIKALKVSKDTWLKIANEAINANRAQPATPLRSVSAS